MDSHKQRKEGWVNMTGFSPSSARGSCSDTKLPPKYRLLGITQSPKHHRAQAKGQSKYCCCWQVCRAGGKPLFYSSPSYLQPSTEEN